LQAIFGALAGSLLLGVLWTCWHFASVLIRCVDASTALVLLAALDEHDDNSELRHEPCPVCSDSGNLGHAVFNSMNTYIAGLFASEPMSAQSAFWKAFGALMRWAGASPFGIGSNTVILSCGIVVALAIVLCTGGRLARPRSTGSAASAKAS
jgi:hypothetical protein